MWLRKRLVEQHALQRLVHLEARRCQKHPTQIGEGTFPSSNSIQTDVPTGGILTVLTLSPVYGKQGIAQPDTAAPRAAGTCALRRARRNGSEISVTTPRNFPHNS